MTELLKLRPGAQVVDPKGGAAIGFQGLWEKLRARVESLGLAKADKESPTLNNTVTVEGFTPTVVWREVDALGALIGLFRARLDLGILKIQRDTAAAPALPFSTAVDVFSTGASPETTPVPTSAGGALTTASSKLRLTPMGPGFHVWLMVTVDANGAGATDLRVQLPFTPRLTGTERYVLTGREDGLSGAQTQGRVTPTGLVIITKFDNTYPGGTGARAFVQGWIESA